MRGLMHPACYLAIQLDGLSGGVWPMEAGCIAETAVSGLTSEGEGWSRDLVRIHRGELGEKGGQPLCTFLESGGDENRRESA